MRATVRALLNQVVDYAGLFPPAKLPLDAALDRYLRERNESPQRWMLGRFVCPVGQLKELGLLVKTRTDAAALQLTALGQPADKASELLNQVQADLERIVDFRAGWGNDAVIDMYEVALPRGVTMAALQPQLPELPAEMADARLAGFLEVPMSPAWEEDVARLADTLHIFQDTQPHATLGMKLRCGGVTAEAFPSDAQAARFIDRCQAAHVPWKATAGLHHPRRYFDETLKVWHHGFLNVFAAGLLAAANPLTVADIAEILADTGGVFFGISDDRLSWKDWSCATTQIAELRATRITSFGSCSFEEPCQDLQAMGWLD